MSTTQRRVLPALLATGALALGLTACGSQEEPEAPAESTSTVAEEPADPTTEAEDTEAPTEDDAAANDATAQFLEHFTAGLDAVQTASTLMVMNDPSGAVIEYKGVIDYTQDPIAMTMTMPSPEDPAIMMETVMVDGVMYINMGERSQGKWVEATGMTEASDPIGEMRAFEAAITDVVHVGPVDLDGVATEQYTVTIDPKLMPAGSVDPGTVLPESIVYEIFLDAEGRPAGMDMEFMGGSINTRLTNFNAPVTITAPAADQIISLEELQGAG